MSGLLLQSGLLPEGLEISFKLIPGIMVTAMLLLFLAVGYVFKVADTEGMWVAGRSIGNVENGMAIGANWMSAASYLGMAATIALFGFYGLAFVVGWSTGYFILLIFMAAQMRRFGKYTAPDFVGDRFNSDSARAMAAVTTFLIGFVYAIGQARGMGLVGLYIFGDIGIPGLSGYQSMVVLMMAITVGYLTLSGMLGATKNMTVQFVILIVAFLAGLYAVGYTQGYSTVLPQLEYGRLIGALSAEFSEPFTTESYYTWIATAFTLVVGTCGLPHVLVRFYTVESERTARWSTVWGLFFICLLYLSAPAFAAFGTDLYANEIGAVYGDPGMSSAAGDVIVVLATQLAGLPEWFVGLVASGGIAAAIATTAGLFIAGSSAISHDIYKGLINPDATQRQQVLVGRLSIVALGVITTLAALDPAAPIAALVTYAFSLAGSVLFPMFFLGLWWENTNRQGALAGMSTGLVVWLIPMVNEVVPSYGLLAGAAGSDGVLSATLAQWLPAIGSALVAAPLVFVVTIAVSMATEEPPLETKRMVRQCHSPEPMGQQQTAEEVVSGAETPGDD
ncbi:MULTISPECIES: sodium:solute symporter family transporter [Halomicrobium]|uniref:Na+/solute symporter n=2 Tax=Halomicrobium mukohataei TaxID=57705 RepID=C7P2M3_HALMD|nr:MULTISPECIES: cation acetate symporter [Halomicrobium]ACV47345.1 Na+/solute symporter [Halomicrobium mukohataei DSM 12286]QCD65813.1 cation acetate symporter [Halomicrobium mukohataei]QFR20618.1 cation acetate symporter [Halomicrobium sp. ZPS1]